MLAFPKRAVHPALIADYDDVRDALNISFSLRDACPSEGKSAGNGIIVRYSLNDQREVLGVLVRHYVRSGWASDEANLATIIARLLSVDVGQVLFALRPYRARNPASAR